MTITYHDGTSALALDSVGSVVLSGLSGSGDITDAGTGKRLTFTLRLKHACWWQQRWNFFRALFQEISRSCAGGTAGHAANDGEQTLTGAIAVTDSTGYLDLREGTLILAPNGNSQSFEYITGAGNLDLLMTEGKPLSLVLRAPSTAQTLSGTVELSVPERLQRSRFPVERGAETTTTSKFFRSSHGYRNTC